MYQQKKFQRGLVGNYCTKLQFQSTKPAVIKKEIIVTTYCKLLGIIVSRTHCAKGLLISTVIIKIGDFVTVNQDQAKVHVFIREFRLLPSVSIILDSF